MEEPQPDLSRTRQGDGRTVGRRRPHSGIGVVRRSVHGPALILILLGFGASFVGTTPRSESQPGSPVIPAATAVAPSQGPVRELVASGNTAETQSKAPGSKA